MDLQSSASFQVTHNVLGNGRHQILVAWGGLTRIATPTQRTAAGAWAVAVPQLIAAAARTHARHRV